VKVLRGKERNILHIWTLANPWERGGQLAARGPNVARHSICSGPRIHSGNIFGCEICSL